MKRKFMAALAALMIGMPVTGRAVPTMPEVTVEVCWDSGYTELEGVLIAPPLSRLGGGVRLQVCKNFPAPQAHQNTILFEEFTQGAGGLEDGHYRIGLDIGVVGYYYAQLSVEIMQEDSGGEVMYESDGETIITLWHHFGWYQIYVGAVDQASIDNQLIGLFCIVPRMGNYYSDEPAYKDSIERQLLQGTDPPNPIFWDWAGSQAVQIDRVHTPSQVNAVNVNRHEPWMTYYSRKAQPTLPNGEPGGLWRVTKIPFQYTKVFITTEQ